ncbi:MAG: glycine/betaine/sarcosine/D-proline family reductase selenoprotein B [Desulfobulbaceae bacterium]|nr:glycine/betaine/sarcosine/D-proline family reductase selenoprotein B [Desulfobulbaceae bacterium]
MVKEIERTGVTIVHCCSIVPISKTVGANRIVPTIAIPYPFGDPDLGPEEEKILRKDLVKKALKALATSIEQQTIF